MGSVCVRPTCKCILPVPEAFSLSPPKGYGDILPYTTVEVGISLVYMLAGVALFGFLIK